MAPTETSGAGTDAFFAQLKQVDAPIPERRPEIDSLAFSGPLATSCSR